MNVQRQHYLVSEGGAGKDAGAPRASRPLIPLRSFFDRGKVRRATAFGAAILVLAFAANFVCAESSKDPDWERAKALSQKGKYKQAVDLYTQVVRKHPKNGWAYYDRAFSYDKLGQTDLAILDWEKCIKLSGPNPQAAWMLGKEYAAKNDSPKALALFTQALRLNPHHPWVRHDRGKIYEAMGSEELAIKDFRENILVNKQDGWSPWHLGRIFQHQEKFGQALVEYDRAVQLRPNDSDLFCERAQTEISLGQPRAAIKDFTEAIKLNPKSVEAHHLLASTYADINEDAKALAEYQLLINELDKHPQNPAYWSERAHVYEKRGDYKQAIADYSVVIARSPGESAYLGRGKAYIKLGQYKNAIDDYSALLELTPDPETLTARGDVYVLDKQYAKAIADYSKSIQLDPKYASRAYAGRAVAYEKIGQNQKAAEDRKKAALLKGY